ncbi:MAG: hypothetical protein AAF830_09845 [Pseudomonadota bacterium]
MSRDDDNTPVPTTGPGAEIVAKSVRDLETMSDTDLLGQDYPEWLKGRKAAARTTVTKGFDERLRAEDAMAEAEELLKKAEAKLGKK